MQRHQQHRLDHTPDLRMARLMLIGVLQTLSPTTPLAAALRQAVTRIEDELDMPHTYPTRQERRKAA